jgi:hypothetical protein
MKITFSIVILIPFFITDCKNSPTQTTTVDLPTQGLLTYYPFSGNANDASGNDFNGIVYGATLTFDRFGKSNSAYHFTVGAYIRIPELFSDSCSAFTFAAWVREDAKDDAYHAIVYKGSQKGEAALVFSPGFLGFGVKLQVPYTPARPKIWYEANIADTLRANTNYFLVGRYIRGQNVDLSINGINVSSSTVPNLNLFSSPLGTYSAIGNNTESGLSPSFWWNGVIDDIRIYNRALSDNEVQSLYHEGGFLGN